MTSTPPAAFMSVFSQENTGASKLFSVCLRHELIREVDSFKQLQSRRSVSGCTPHNQLYYYYYYYY